MYAGYYNIFYTCTRILRFIYGFIYYVYDNKIFVRIINSNISIRVSEHEFLDEIYCLFFWSFLIIVITSRAILASIILCTIQSLIYLQAPIRLYFNAWDRYFISYNVCASAITRAKSYFYL